MTNQYDFYFKTVNDMSGASFFDYPKYICFVTKHIIHCKK